MSTISGTISYKTVVTVVGASGDGATVAAVFNGLNFPSIANTTATATNSSGTVTISWPNANMLVSNDIAGQFVAAELAPLTSLTSPITITATTQRWLTV